MAERPLGMYSQGRGIDPEFDPDELLYIRVSRDGITTDGERVLDAAFRLPSQSTNRQRYCEVPEWVLYPEYFDWGIAALQVQDVPREMISRGETRYSFRVEHVPREDNYAHSEIRAYKGAQQCFNERLTVNRAVRKNFRTRLAMAATLIRRPAAKAC